MDKLVYIVDTSERRGEVILEALRFEGYNAVDFNNIPSSKNRKVYIYSLSKEVDVSAVAKIEKGSILFGRLADSSVKAYLSDKEIKHFCFFEDEAFVVKNAYITAEGALSYIIQNTEETIRQMPILVLGFGRVGKSMSKLLKDNYAVVSVATEDETEYALASILSDKVYKLTELPETISQYKAIVNTIPQIILKGETLKLISKDCFILDIASKPGGVDYEQAEKLMLKTMHALGIPGKTSPKTAGLYLKESVLKRLSLYINYEK